MKLSGHKKGVLLVLLLLILLVVYFMGVVITSQTIKNIGALDFSREDGKMRFATYNMMFGMYGRSSFSALFGHLAFHGIHSSTLTNFFSRYNKRDVEFVGKVNADIVSLNEVLGTLKKEEVIDELGKQGFKYFSWGPAGHYDPPLDIGTLLASKYKFEKLNFSLPMSDHFGGGGGAVAVYIREKNLSVLAVHLSLDEGISVQQIKAVSNFVKREKKKKRRVVLMGDFNLEERELDDDLEFDELNLSGANKKDTSPDIGLIKHFKFESVDNIFYDSSFNLEGSGVLDGYSDHRLVYADLK